METEGYREEAPSRVIATGENAAVLRARSPLDRREVFVQVNFEDVGTYWPYAAGGPLREYFRRIE